MKLNINAGLFQTLLLTFTWALHAQPISDSALAQVRFDQKLNAQVPLALPFVDETGKEVRLGDYFRGKPVLLVLGYYQCPMLCTLVLNGMIESAAEMKWSIGREFDVVNVSINPNETAALAAAKKRAYVRRYGRSKAAEGWHFLTGTDPSIQRLTEEVGFHYAFDPASKEYAHPSGLIILTPQGKVSHYLMGVTYPSSDLYAALEQASSNKIGSAVRELILLCFHYNPIHGKYSGVIMGILRVLAAATPVVLLGYIFALVRGRAGETRANASGKNAGCEVLPVLDEMKEQSH
jgi:protein SCO1/2